MYDADLLAREFGLIFRHVGACSVEDLEGDFSNLPPTFVKPGVGSGDRAPDDHCMIRRRGVTTSRHRRRRD